MVSAVTEPLVRLIRSCAISSGHEPGAAITACESTIKMQMVEIDRLRDEIKQLVEWINGDRDALTCLQAVYNNPNTSEANRVKAAAAAIGFERSKVTVSVRVGPAVLGDRLDQAKVVNPPLGLTLSSR